MTKVIAGSDLANRIREQFPDAVMDWNDTAVWVDSSSLHQIAAFLKNTPGQDYSFLTSITSVDYVEYFELVYRLVSLRRNASAVIKTRLYGRDGLSAVSVVDVWKGAELQEREIWDLMGIRFEGHPNMKRLLLWEGFPGHPLRKDFIR